MLPLLWNSSRSAAAKGGRGRPGPRVRLALALVAIAAIWLGILPAVAQVSSVNRMIRRQEAHGVDPSAKFYSELPAMPMITQRVDQIRDENAAAFWGP